eukprot:752302-Hanusia_phi.AAC.9
MSSREAEAMVRSDFLSKFVAWSGVVTLSNDKTYIYDTHDIDRIEQAIYFERPHVAHCFLGHNKEDKYAPMMNKESYLEEFNTYLIKRRANDASSKTRSTAKTPFNGQMQGTCIYCIYFCDDCSEKRVKAKQFVYARKNQARVIDYTVFMGICEEHHHKHNDEECQRLANLFRTKKVSAWYKKFQPMEQRPSGQGIEFSASEDEDDVIDVTPAAEAGPCSALQEEGGVQRTPERPTFNDDDVIEDSQELPPTPRTPPTPRPDRSASLPIPTEVFPRMETETEPDKESTAAPPDSTVPEPDSTAAETTDVERMERMAADQVAAMAEKQIMKRPKQDKPRAASNKRTGSSRPSVADSVSPDKRQKTSEDDVVKSKIKEAMQLMRYAFDACRAREESSKNHVAAHLKLEEENREMQAIIDRFKERFKALEERNNLLDAKVEDLQKTNEMLKSENTMFMRDVKPLMSRSMAEIQELTAEMQCMHRVHAAQERQIATLKEENVAKSRKLQNVLDMITK